MNEIQTVTIPAHEHHEGIASLTVKLKWACPICGRPRGQVIPVRSYDGSRILYCDGWVNPCGHIDKYLTVRLEAADNGLNHRVINPTY